MTNCKYITKNGICGLKGSDAYQHGCFGEDRCRCREPMTNADRIRAMSDEELDDFLQKVMYGMDECPHEYGSEKALEWLQRPSERRMIMAEYIEREATIELLRSLGSRDYRREKGTIQEAIKMVSSSEYTPAADVAPVVHGRWVEKEKYTFGIMYDCSLCENRILDNGHPWNYCPNCGAKMDGDE